MGREAVENGGKVAVTPRVMIANKQRKDIDAVASSSAKANGGTSRPSSRNQDLNVFVAQRDRCRRLIERHEFETVGFRNVQKRCIRHLAVAHDLPCQFRKGRLRERRRGAVLFVPRMGDDRFKQADRLLAVDACLYDLRVD